MEVTRKRSDLKLVAIADGAQSFWPFLTGLVPEVEVLDFYHATTQLSAASQHTTNPQSWFSQWRDVLRDEPQGVDRVIGAIRGIRNRSDNEAVREELTVILNYFRKYRHRMQYHGLKRQGYPIGSGIIEAINKTHANQRMKRSGMR